MKNLIAFIGTAILAAACGGTTAGLPNDGGLIQTSNLAETSTAVLPGETLGAYINYQNESAAPIVIDRFVMAAIIPDQNADAGTFKSFQVPEGPVTIQPGYQFQLSGSASFTTADVPGVYELYSAYLDTSGVWHQSNVLKFTLIGANSSASST